MGFDSPLTGAGGKVSHQQKGTIMSARENLSALLATRGKGGSLESITQAGSHFSKDKTLTPSDFISAEKLDASKAITLLGGYVVSQYGIAPKDAYAMRNVFAKEYRQVLPLFELDKAAFISSIDEIEGEIAKTEADKASLSASLGTDAERYIKNAQSAIDKVVDANISPKVRHDLLTLIASAQRKLEYAPLKVAQNA
jgi:hypothetical protein